MLKLLCVLGLGLGVATPALAATNWSFGGTFGTLGMGPELSVRHGHFGMHANGTFLTLNGHVSSRNLRYRNRLDLRSAGAMLDLYPFGGRFHLSAGARYNGNSGKVRATPQQVTNIGGADFMAQTVGTISGRADTRKFAPAVSAGIASKRSEGFEWRIEGGVMFQGGVRVSPLTTSTGLIPVERLAAERDALQDDLGRYHVFPIAQIEFGWRF